MERKLRYRYYDTPDGQDYFKKLYFLMRPSVDSSLFLGCSDVIFASKPVGWFPLIERFIRVSIRPIATAFLFETSVYMATNIRKKDDGFNHAFGGAVIGYYWNRFIAHPQMVAPLTVFLCLSLYLWKEAKMKGNQIMYDPYAQEEEIYYGAWSRFNTWTLTKKLPREWLTPEEAAAKGIQV